MSDPVKHLNTTGIPDEQFDRLLFTIIGKLDALYMVEKPMTPDEAAEFVRYKRSQFDALVAKGIFEPRRVEPGADPRFFPSDLIKGFKKIGRIS